ncbi:hypothetical protein AN6198.2 [Aspergillus nidulans FGSC A4]|uniref:Uncharacterized protein n=1 Tax=Emericella nidulans (strain FGSC A4 / ATCC 38163 / CBS 112.46 / NRRL 194 / M139) TaxID=227321 RepID=Q5AZT2_EMENI|nr:hypothetical protein [Aspergillus nidulans FGSC A4]EAA57984.1 hypothetical protein AN6198.2 [Aspergillus nidulans FGSC A4]CBF69987.1 TPA: conserved hypothetical protein [Aspergillus nidulans FGSC A4]|eukprot:XP_663802.1 hypothetical protein AN6198.2 [Aspergillus nidulans FGSC A4]
MTQDDSARIMCADAPEAASKMKSRPDSTAGVPSLSTDSASTRSTSSSLSLRTMWASGVIGGGILEEDDTGALVLPPDHINQRHIQSPSPPSSPLLRQQQIYTCLFHILDCHDTFDNCEQWKTHVLSHFRMHEPPDTARCPLCPAQRFSSTPHQRAWDLMLKHVDVAHYQQGQTLAGSRPDFELMRYLYNLRVISVEQFKAMQLAPQPSSPAYHRRQDTSVVDISHVAVLRSSNLALSCAFCRNPFHAE